MHSLADLQSRVARAVTMGERETFIAQLLGGASPEKRLDIHSRHYHASLHTALREKFSACVWLAGADFVDGAASAFVQAHPPQRPCMAEYGEDFPQFLANYGRAVTMPYLETFARLEWAVGQVSVAIDYSPLSWTELAQIGTERLVDSTIGLQPGLRYLRTAHCVDKLMALYLGGAEPDRFVLEESDTFIEVRGARGTVHIATLDAPAFTVRAELAAGNSVGNAAGSALECFSAFDVGAALRLLVQSGLVTNTSDVRETTL